MPFGDEHAEATQHVLYDEIARRLEEVSHRDAGFAEGLITAFAPRAC